MSVVPIPDDVDVDTLHPRVVKLFDKIQYAQRTPEWYEIRKNLMTASEVASALKIKPFAGFKGCPREELLKKKLNETPVMGMALEHGVKYESEAAEHAMNILGERMFEFGLIVHDEHEWLAASPDGITASGIAIEIKCPMRRKIVPGEVPHHYMPQVQLQLEVCDLDKCYFIQYKPGFMTDDGLPYVDITVVERDRQWFVDNKDAMFEFWKELMERKQTHVKEISEPELVSLIVDDLYDMSDLNYVREFDTTSEVFDPSIESLIIDDLYDTTDLNYVREFVTISEVFNVS